MSDGNKGKRKKKSDRRHRDGERREPRDETLGPGRPKDVAEDARRRIEEQVRDAGVDPDDPLRGGTAAG